MCVSCLMSRKRKRVMGGSTTRGVSSGDLNHRGVKQGLWLLLILVLFVIGSALVRFGWKHWQNASWQGVEPFRYILVEGEKEAYQIRMYQLIPTEQSLVVYTIPDDVVVDARDYGPYPIRSLVTLGELERKDLQVLHEAMETAFGVSINHVGISDRDLSDSLKTSAQVLLGQALLGQGNFVDALKVWQTMEQVSQASVEYFTLADTSLYDIKENVDGSEQRFFNQLQLDRFQADTILPETSPLRDVEVVVENGTNTAGLAGQYSRYVAHQGFDVVNIVDGLRPAPISELRFANENILNSIEGRILSAMFPFLQKTIGETDGFRADVVIRLADDAKEI